MAEKRPTQRANVPLRQGATRAEVYNEGLFVFAYDAANEALLRD